jgi:hypothetical protein
MKTERSTKSNYPKRLPGIAAASVNRDVEVCVGGSGGDIGAKCADSLHQGTEVAISAGVERDEEMPLAGACDGRIVELDYLSKPRILCVLRADTGWPHLIVSDDLPFGTIREESAVPIPAG